MSIFISHSSKDEYIINQFTEKILSLGCDIKDNQIFCTSIDGLGIKTGEDFRTHIHQNLVNADFSLIMVSENYKQSEVCLNEMGASWVIDNVKVKQLLFPDIGFESLGLLLNVQQASRIDKSADLDELFEEFSKHYQTNKKIVRWNKHKKDFLDILSKYKSENSNQIFPSPNNYFKQFIIKNASINTLLLTAHPTLLDCKAVFQEKYYRKSFEVNCHMFEKLSNDYFESLYPKKKSFRIIKTSVTDLCNGINNITGGMVNAAKKGFFNYNLEFYSVTFLENETDQFGISYHVFCYINDKWVFFPKPWRL